MVKIFRYNKTLIATLAMMTGLTFTACEDYPDAYEVAGGLPSVDYVRCLSTEIETSTDSESTQYTNGQFVTSASPQAILCLVGENLRSVYQMYFNDQEAILNTSYITDNTLIVQVPRTVPEAVSDKIYMITSSNDTVTYDFEVIIPSPVISSMSCEYAQPGTQATLYGSYIIDDANVPLTITFPDGSVVTDYEVDSSYSSVTFTVPECTEEGALTVTSVYGTTTTSFHYLDTRGMMFEFDGVTGLSNHGWHDRTITTDETAITGNYVQLGDGTTTLDETGGWNDSSFSFEYWPGSWNTPVDYPEGEGERLFDLVDFSDYRNMTLKFEMYIPSSSPWSAGAMQIIFAGTDKVSYGNSGLDVYGNTVAGPNNTYLQDDVLPRALYRPWTDSGSYDTDDEWVTVSLPISSSFIYGYSGSTASGTLTENDFASLVIFVVGGGINGTECTPLIKIDNVRAIPN
ncbi:MAG: glycan-binding surface protein [Bacteroides sp.]|nr:glycan-binding surface protein [Bacteroides sp.]